MTNKEKKTIIGALCRKWRRSNGLRLSDIAKQCDTVISNIFRFEHGSNDSCVILMAYFDLGMPFDQVYPYVEKKEEVISHEQS